MDRLQWHHGDVITVASQITNLTIVYSTVWSDADQRQHQCSAFLACMCGEFTGDWWIPRTNGQYAENVSIWWRHHGSAGHIAPWVKCDPKELAFWCAILIAHQLLWQNMEAPVYIFQESPLAGEPRQRLFHIHSVNRYQLRTKYLYPSTLLWQINGCNF